MVKVCLNMIVRDEAANIERCLRSMVDHVDCWLICDTGSSDATRDLVRTAFEARGIPGSLHEVPFETFDQARNAALDLARRSSLDFDYILFADADMELVVSDAGWRERLSAAAYQLRQDSGVAYWNTRLLRRDAVARYVGVTHEYLALSAGETRQLHGLAFVDHASGANRPGKFARDARLLRTALESEADDGLRARYTFYLANSLRDDGDHAEALACYLRRADMGHWSEEIFLSLCDAAELMARLGHADETVLATFERATAACPTRAEALHGAARFCRTKGLHERGYGFAARAAALPLPVAGLFVAEWVYRYGALDEMAVAAYWSGRPADCVAACDRLLEEPTLPAGERPRVAANRRFGADRLREAAAASRGKRDAIPRTVHFITGLDAGFGGKPFSFVHAMAIVSALRVNNDFSAQVHYEHEPSGPYWDFVKPMVTCVPIVAPREFCGHPIEHFANKADICRLQILIEHGGIYLDMDTICQKPFAPLLDGAVVMGLEQTSDGTPIGLCNATIVAPPGAAFLELWLATYNDFTVWNRFAVQLPKRLADEHPDLVRIEPYTAFFWPSWDEAGIGALFVEDGSFPKAYSFHLWESKSWSHLQGLDADAVLTRDTAYNRVARRFLSDDWPGARPRSPAPPGAPAGLEDAARRGAAAALAGALQHPATARRLDMQVEAYWAAKRSRSRNPLLRHGEKYFSQSDEDGLTLEICRRLGLSAGRALEFGVGNGLENNTLILLMNGWRVAWVGGEDLAFRLPPSCEALTFAKSWVTAENCAALAAEALGGGGLDLLSVDLDGNDLFVLERLLAAGLTPAVVVVEYNGKFPPPIRWSIRYDAGHAWDGSDYQGASLQSFVDLCARFGYRLVCCNLTGTNAFFVRASSMTRFADIPTEPADLFVAADYNWFVGRGHAVSPRTIEVLLEPASRET